MDKEKKKKWLETEIKYCKSMIQDPGEYFYRIEMAEKELRILDTEDSFTSNKEQETNEQI